jgi:hypothetical protein
MRKTAASALTLSHPLSNPLSYSYSYSYSLTLSLSYSLTLSLSYSLTLSLSYSLTLSYSLALPLARGMRQDPGAEARPDGDSLDRGEREERDAVCNGGGHDVGDDGLILDGIQGACAVDEPASGR